MKNSLTTSFEVAHVFATRSNENAYCRNTSIRVDYEGNWHYKSYSTSIAQFIKNAKSEEAILLDDTSYSNTTNKHQWELRAATRQYKQFFRTQTDLSVVVVRVRTILQDLLPTAKSKKDSYIQEVISLGNSFEEFVNWYGGKDNMPYFNTDSHKELLDAVALVKNTAALLEHSSGYVAKKKQAAKDKKEYETAQNLERKNKYQKEVNKFLNYEVSSIYVSGYDEKEDFLRISKDGQFVETTQRVKIPVAAATLLYKMILAGKDIKGYNIEGYTVRSLNGHLVVGCHNINVENMHEVGKKLLE